MVQSIGGGTKRKRCVFEETIEVLVGTEEVKFVLHQDAIHKRSRFLAAASSERWNGSEAPIKLPDENPVVFGVYVKCNYGWFLGPNIPRDAISHGSNSKTDDVADEDDGPGDDEVGRYTRFLVLLYNLADKLGDLRTANMVMDAFQGFCDHYNVITTPKVVQQIWKSTPENSPLREYVRDLWLRRASDDAFEEDETWKIPKAFLLVLTKQYRQLVKAAERGTAIGSVLERQESTVDQEGVEEKSNDYRKRRICRYHQHDEWCPPCSKVPGDGAVEDEEFRLHGGGAGAPHS